MVTCIKMIHVRYRNVDIITAIDCYVKTVKTADTTKQAAMEAMKPRSAGNYTASVLTVPTYQNSFPQI